MLKSAILKIPKKTVKWRHRAKGRDAISYTASTMPTKLWIDGYTAAGETLAGVGDYDSQSEKYSLRIHIHGRNYLNERTLFDRMLLYTRSKTDSTLYFMFALDPEYEGQPVLDKTILKFKENTTYTLLAEANRVYTGNKANLEMSYVYSDGSTKQLAYPPADELDICWWAIPSDENKSIEKIVVGYEYNERRARFAKGTVGIYEGIYDANEENYEAYDGEFFTISLDEPLFSLGHFYDRISLTDSRLIRKIKRLALSAENAEYESGIFKIPLSEPARAGYDFIALGTDKITESEINEGRLGIAISDSGDMLLLRASGIESVEALSEALLEAPITLLYVRENFLEEKIDFKLPERTGYVGIEVYSNITPRRILAEYF